MESAVIRRLTLPAHTRILAASDIHGHGLYLAALLDKAGFSKRDCLFLLGDFLEKGPESLKTLRYIMNLCRDFTVYPLLGNVDAGQLRRLDAESPEADGKLAEYLAFMKQTYGGCFFTDLCEEAGIPYGTLSELHTAKRKIKTLFAEELDFLRALPTVYETSRFVFVHAGLPTAELSELEKYDVWSFLKLDAFQKRGLCFEKYVVAGHWPVMLYADRQPQCNPIINRRQKIISIDGGCGIKEDGQLNLLVIPEETSEHFTFESYDMLPVGTAADAQEERPGELFIKWTDSACELLEENGEFSRIRHKSSGKIFEVPSDQLFYMDGVLSCGDYSDYRLPVCPGDRLSVARTTSRGYYVKKEGRSGWYCGTLIPELP